MTLRSAPIVYDPSLYVLKHTVAPAVLIEHAFHTNENDVKNLRSDAWRASVAEAEARGITDYLGIPWVSETPQEPSVDVELEQAVTWAQSAGIMEGYADGAMHLGDAVTRHQLMLVIYRLAKWANLV